MRTIEWDSKAHQLIVINQRLIPQRLERVALSSCQDIGQAIKDMTIRGAPVIGVAAAFGVVLSALQSSSDNVTMLRQDLEQSIQYLGSTRPTAVNLQWALERMHMVARSSDQPAGIRQSLEREAMQMADEDVETNQAIARHGEELIEDGDTIIHHCNTGALATVDWGTGLGIIRLAHEQGKRIHILVDETRPRLQGTRLTAWELKQYGIPYDIITDNMAGHFLSRGMVQKVIFGADRVAANGDVANKIGSYMLALAAYDNVVPVYSVFPLSTVDLDISQGSDIPIENRDPNEVLDIQLDGERVTPEGSSALNPAFDITPARLISAFVTERGIVRPPYFKNLSQIKGKK
ncbi:MAG: S-methyl-5-thioribose-1-phosphate isomerase [Anaerolineaceae bacterium]|nr:S-methyl-5-thioribose-1-phosphate isomerase [Anaerolineaceae bacterium]MBN2676757.1 S-methyl-5-thioribose-1-phosphate isomerase [Anaerolineaceae bacterium]